MSETADSQDVETSPAGREAGVASAAAGAGNEIPEAMAYKVTLPEFEGPLDLLLHLCKSHEIDILEIPISFITQKYLEYLDLMQTLSVEVAAEYLVMAATLAYLKSRELVPQPEALEVQGEEGEEAGDPKEELIRRLLEYQKYKDAAEKLGNRPIEGKNVFGRGMPVELEKGPEVLAEHSPWKLIEYFADLLQEAAPEHTHDVEIDRMSVAQRINQLIDKLEAGEGSFRFDSIIDFTAPMAELRHQVVVTLLAILELAKLKAIRVLQDPVSETFFVARASSTSDDVLRAARKATTSSDGGGTLPPEDEEANDAATATAEVTLAEEGEANVEEGAMEIDPGVVVDGVEVDAGVVVDAAEVVDAGVVVNVSEIVSAPEPGPAAEPADEADAGPATVDEDLDGKA